MNIGKTKRDFYCNGFGGRRYDLAGSIIAAEGKNFIVAVTQDNKPVLFDFSDYPDEEQEEVKNDHIIMWT